MWRLVFPNDLNSTMASCNVSSSASSRFMVRLTIKQSPISTISWESWWSSCTCKTPSYTGRGKLPGENVREVSGQLIVGPTAVTHEYRCLEKPHEP